jgi:integrase
MASRECPNCHSKEICKDGFRRTNNGLIQRYLCNQCGFRFSDSKNLNLDSDIYDVNQLCATIEAKKLDTATETTTVAGEIEKRQQEAKGKIIQFGILLQNKGKTRETIRTYTGALYTLLNKGANILDPQSVEEIVAKQNWSVRAKRNYVTWYARFAKFLHIEWEKPEYKAPNKIPFIPLESEIDQLISGCPKKVSIALQIAKETAARVGEILRIKWIDIDFEKSILSINEPEKGSNSGTYKISSALITRISTLPKKSDRIFGKGSSDSITNSFIATRRRLADSFCNPRLIQIHFHTLRHWKLTTYAHQIKDPFQVQLFARHKDMKSTARYIHLEQVLYQPSEKDEWTVKAVKTVNEAIELTSVGFEYVTEVEGFKLFRKRK